MSQGSQKGFSLIELLLVVTIVGVITAIGIPSFQRGIRAADNGAAFAQLRTISSMQLTHFSQRNRWATITELNAMRPGVLGVLSPAGTSLTKGRFIYEMTPLNPTPQDLTSSYTITANGVFGVSDLPYVFRVDQTGEIVQITP